MIRKIALLGTAVLAFSAVGVTAASAGGTPPTGTLNCGATGTATITPGIPDSSQPAATKALSITVKGATGACDPTLTTGGKAPINGTSIILNAKTAVGSSCATLLSAPPNIAKAVLVVKLTNTTAGKTMTVAVIKPTNLQWTQVGAGFHITGTIPAIAGKPFSGETFDAQINVDNLADAIACVSPGTTPLTHIDFSAADGSGFSIHP